MSAEDEFFDYTCKCGPAREDCFVECVCACHDCECGCHAFDDAPHRRKCETCGHIPPTKTGANA